MKIDILNVPVYKNLIPFIKQISAGKNAEAFLVGGAVRDILLNAPLHDIDLVIFSYDYANFAEELSNKLRSPAIPFKDNIRIPYMRGHIDISAPRGANVYEDLQKRDFTINNLAIDIDGNLIGDPRDIQNKLIIPVYPNAFDDDPLRIVRGFRQSASLGFTMTPEFIELAASKAILLKNVASERIYNELNLLAAAAPDINIYDIIAQTGVWKEILGYSPDSDSLYNALILSTKNNHDETTRFSFFLAAALLNFNGNDKTLLKKINASNQVMQKTLWLLETSEALHNAGDNPALLKQLLWRSHKKEYSDFLFDFMRVRYKKTDEEIKHYQKLHSQINDGQAELIDGNDLLNIALAEFPEFKNGSWISQILEDTKIALAYGDIQGREAAAEYIKSALQRRH